jgi:PIN domain nuclease of toxin-antitoxin system
MNYLLDTHTFLWLVNSPEMLPDRVFDRIQDRHHRDPFDRLLIAQALDLGVPILGSDRTFDLYGVRRIWD